MRRSIFAGAMALLVATAPAAAAPILWIDDAGGTIGTVDVATGAANVIGDAGVVLTDIAFDPAGDLWGISFTTLYRIDRNTGAVTNQGLLGINGANALVFGGDGTLYAAAVNTTNLYQVDTATGTATSLGSIGFFSAGDLAFHGGDLFLSGTNNQLIRIDLADPSASVAVGPLGFSSVFGLATADNGVLYGVSGTQVFSVDTATGAGTFVSDYAGGGLLAANGTAFVTEAGAPPIVTALPEPAGVLLLGIGMAALALVRRRRLRTAGTGFARLLRAVFRRRSRG